MKTLEVTLKHLILPNGTMDPRVWSGILICLRETRKEISQLRFFNLSLHSSYFGKPMDNNMLRSIKMLNKRNI